MPSFETNLNIITQTLAHNPRQSIMVWGAPGNGKTTLATSAAEPLGIPGENVYVFRPSLHDPVDLLGIPHVNGDKATHWAPPSWLKNLQTGKNLLVIDDLPQGVAMMQNALAGLILDRKIGELTLSDDTYIVATGNRTTDKAGANRMVSQLANRLLHIQQESNLDGWTKWALDNDMPMHVIAFLRFRPDYLNAFNPDHLQNPTERTWEMVGRLPDYTGSHAEEIYTTAVTGLVGEAAAAELSGFRRVMDKMPNPDMILLNPDDSPVPEDAATRYALSGALARKSTPDNFDRVTRYTSRMPPEFQLLVAMDASRLQPKIKDTPAFTKWAWENSQYMC